MRLDGPQWTAQNDATLRMLKINEAFLLASTEQEILAAVGLHADKDATLYLLYLDGDQMVRSNTAMSVAACWKDGKMLEVEPLLSGHPMTSSNVSAFLSILAASDNPVLLIEDVHQDSPIMLPSFLTGARSMAAIKLYSLRASVNQDWNALICFTWPTFHMFSNDEKYLYTAIFQFASAVVSNHRMWREAQRNVERLRELDRLKNEFLASVSHELRTPLVGVLTLSDNILNGVDGEINEEVRTDVSWIHRSGQQLLAVINDILDFARLESDEQISLEVEQFPIGDLIWDAVELVRRTMADAKGLLITFDGVPKSAQVRADRTSIRQVMLNLLSNAVKFSEKGVVSVAVERQETVLVVCVRDEGIGIAPDHQALIFEPFRQVDGSLSRKVGGAGLGLSICKRLVALHGGQIWVKSVLGQGSSFYFSLPNGRSL
jgi:signal transduction histidine kinase